MELIYFKYDLYRYFYFSEKNRRVSIFRKIQTILLTQGIWATAVYRLRRWAEYECRIYILKKMLIFIYPLMNLLMQILTGIYITKESKIGPGLYIGHYGNILVEGSLGKMCNISHEVTVGFAGRGERLGAPEIGDFVYIAPGAKVLGKIKIGNHVAIGANAVVTKSLEDSAVAVGVPAKVISHQGSHGIIQFNAEKFKPILD